MKMFVTFKIVMPFTQEIIHSTSSPVRDLFNPWAGVVVIVLLVSSKHYSSLGSHSKSCDLTQTCGLV